MKSQFLVLLIAMSLIGASLGFSQEIFANPDDNESKKSYEAVDTSINQNQTNDKDSQHIPIGKQIQIISDVTNKQDRTQPFAYIVQIQDENGIIVSLGWLTGELDPYQSLSPALSWIPENAGIYTATIFVWEGIDIPLALSYPLKMTLEVK